jgi:hypothetical protein
MFTPTKLHTCLHLCTPCSVLCLWMVWPNSYLRLTLYLCIGPFYSHYSKTSLQWWSLLFAVASVLLDPLDHPQHIHVYLTHKRQNSFCPSFSNSHSLLLPLYNRTLQKWFSISTFSHLSLFNQIWLVTELSFRWKSNPSTNDFIFPWWLLELFGIRRKLYAESWFYVLILNFIILKLSNKTTNRRKHLSDFFLMRRGSI